MRYKFLETLKYSRLYIQPEIFFIYTLIVLMCTYLKIEKQEKSSNN